MNFVHTGENVKFQFWCITYNLDFHLFITKLVIINVKTFQNHPQIFSQLDSNMSSPLTRITWFLSMTVYFLQRIQLMMLTMILMLIINFLNEQIYFLTIGTGLSCTIVVNDNNEWMNEWMGDIILFWMFSNEIYFLIFLDLPEIGS